MAQFLAADAAAVAYAAYEGHAAALGEEVAAYADVPAAVKTELAGVVTSIWADDTITPAEAQLTLITTRRGADWEYGLTYDATAKTDPLIQDYASLPQLTRALWEILVKVAVATSAYENFETPD